jgi:predicted lipid-binding transport protein (Tim44 family)
MRRLKLLAGPMLIAAALVFTPCVSDARPGMGGSIGSRGSHTYSAAPGTAGAPNGASPSTQSMTPNSGSAYGGGYGGGGYGGGGYGMRGGMMGGGMFGRGMGGGLFGRGMGMRGGFMTGMLGGLLGAGIGGMLFGRGFFGFHGGSGFLGLLLQIGLLFLLVRWLMRRFGGGMPAFAGMGGFGRSMFQQQPARPQGMGLGGSAARARPVTLGSGDYQMFSQLLTGIQGAWSQHDLNGLQAMATPEMVSYFADQMADQTSRGVRNQVLDVRLQQGDLSEAWAEDNREYATVSMRFAMIDVTRDNAGRVVDGSATERVTVTEFWTFLRSSGGHWVLSAIQQAR